MVPPAFARLPGLESLRKQAIPATLQGQPPRLGQRRGFRGLDLLPRTNRQLSGRQASYLSPRRLLVNSADYTRTWVTVK